MTGVGRKFSKAAVVVFAVASLPLTSDFARAQDLAIDGDAIVPGEIMPGICMTRKTPTSSPEPALESSRTIVAAAIDVEGLTVKGFVISNCPASLRAHALVQEWRDLVCHAASQNDEEAQTYFEIEWGVRAAQLCGSIERVVGPWDGLATGAMSNH